MGGHIGGGVQSQQDTYLATGLQAGLSGCLNEGAREPIHWRRGLAVRRLDLQPVSSLARPCVRLFVESRLIWARRRQPDFVPDRSTHRVRYDPETLLRRSPGLCRVARIWQLVGSDRCRAHSICFR